jgi:tetratricopeptide (TPR) repeat protein
MAIDTPRTLPDLKHFYPTAWYAKAARHTTRGSLSSGGLSLHPSADFDQHSSAALLGSEDTEELLDMLMRAHLIHRGLAGRLSMHDLLRAYARQLAEKTDGDQKLRAALTGLFDYYVATAAAATNMLHSGQSSQRLPVETAGIQRTFTDREKALAWLNAERPALVAICDYCATHGWPEHVSALARTLLRYLDAGHYTDALAIYTHALNAATVTHDNAAQAAALTNLGTIYWRLGSYRKAGDYHQRALDLFRIIADTTGQARAHGNLGAVHTQLGLYQSATEHLDHALEMFRNTGNELGEALAHASLGLVQQRVGRYDSSNAHHLEALNMFRRLGDRVGEATELNNLGLVEARLGQYAAAANHHQQALDLFRRAGHRLGEAFANTGIGDVHKREGRYRQAAHHHQMAHAIFDDLGDKHGQAVALNGIGEALLGLNQHEEAIARHTAALTISELTEGRDEQARARAGMARVRHALHDTIGAAEDFRRALRLYNDLSSPDADTLRADLAVLDLG